MPALDRTATIAQIVLDHPECARVFREHRIDFCCRGDQSVTEACKGKGLEPAAVFEALERALAERAPSDVDLRDLPTSDVVAFIVSRHHEYLRRVLPFVDPLAQKVARVHGEHNPKLVDLAKVVTTIREVLEPHLDDEEASLFPALLASGGDARGLADDLSAMQEEHLRVGHALEQMRGLADDYVVPGWACGSYRTLLRELESLEKDTLAHVHAENHVLLPRFVRRGRADVASGTAS